MLLAVLATVRWAQSSGGAIGLVAPLVGLRVGRVPSKLCSSLVLWGVPASSSLSSESVCDFAAGLCDVVFLAGNV